MPSNQLNNFNLQFGFRTTTNIINIRNPKTSDIKSNPLVDGALEIISKQSNSYAKSSSPTSINPVISGNKNPGISKLTWLSNRNKCNIFIGEVLTKANFAMPMYKMADGSHHYVNAENLIKYRSYFKVIENKKDVKPGDIMIIDYKFANSENGAHAEIVISCDTNANQLYTAGAHKNGAYIKNNSAIFQKLGNNLSTNNFLVNICANIHFLSPQKTIS